MKKIRYVFIIAFSILQLSCFSVPTRDYGAYNPSNIPEEELCTLIIDQHVTVDKFNDDSVNWDVASAEKTVIIPAGVHTFYARFNDGRMVSRGAAPVIGRLEKGNTYILKGTVNVIFAEYKIFLYNDRQQGQEVSLNINRLQGIDNSTLSVFIRRVMNPTSQDVGNTVKLENDKYILLFEPDMVYAMTDKTTGRTSRGRHGFSMDFSMTNGKVFLYETDITKMSSQQFLESQYQQNSQIILIPTRCTYNEVVFTYEKPANLLGEKITFTITEIKS